MSESEQQLKIEDFDKSLAERQNLFSPGGVSHKLPSFLVHSSEAAKRLLDRLEAMQSGDRVKYGIPTGFIDLDNLTLGLQRSQLTILGGETGMGKTALASNFAANAVLKYRANVGYFSLETSAEALYARLLSQESQIDIDRIRKARFTEQESLKLTHALGFLYEAPLFISERYPISLDELIDQTHLLHSQLLQNSANPGTNLKTSTRQGLDLLIIDRVEMIQSHRRNRPVADLLKGLAQELNIAVLAVTNTIPKKEMRSRNLFKEYADSVLFLDRPDQHEKDSEEKGIAKIHVVKNRFGPPGEISLLFNGRSFNFVDLEPFRE